MRAYHKQFYRPENLKIIIVGQISPIDVFKALEPLEQQILSKVKSLYLSGNKNYFILRVNKISHSLSTEF